VNEAELFDACDAYVAPFRGEPEAWEDVLRRARSRRRLPRRRIVVGLLAAVAVLGAAPALAVLLLSRPPRLPDGADRAQIEVALDPQSGRILAQVAPWRGHDGICYFVPSVRAGCVRRTPRSTVILSSPPMGFTFYSRIVSARVLLVGGGWRRIVLHWFGPPLDVAFFFPPRLGDVRVLQLRDRHGRVVGQSLYGP
jgi:hypothetical protein